MASFVMAGKPENGFVLLQQMRWHSSVKDVIELCVQFCATHEQLQAYIQTVLNIIADSNCDTITEVFRVLQVSYALNDNGQIWLEQAVLKAACVRLAYSPQCRPYFEELKYIHEDQFIHEHWNAEVNPAGRYDTV